jgi:hypothetical protein
MLKQLAQRQPMKLLEHSTKLDELLFKMLDIEVGLPTPYTLLTRFRTTPNRTES